MWCGTRPPGKVEEREEEEAENAENAGNVAEVVEAVGERRPERPIQPDCCAGISQRRSSKAKEAIKAAHKAWEGNQERRP